jgi:hypothetical protein
MSTTRSCLNRLSWRNFQSFKNKKLIGEAIFSGTVKNQKKGKKQDIFN